MLLTALLCSLALAVTGQEAANDWVDPYDMLNYDASTKTMRKPAEPVNYDHVATKRRQYTQDSSQAEVAACKAEVVNLQRQIEEQKKKITLISQQPTCNPVFKRFLTRLLRDVKRVGVPSDSTDDLYDAKIKLSKQSMTEIQALLDGEDNWRTGALDSAISQILVDLKQHDYEAWKWRFEDTFGVDLDTLLKIVIVIGIIIVTICTELWSPVSWFLQFRRLFAVCFIISIIWNWFYLYKIAFAEHQKNIAQLDGVNEKCTGMKKIDWSDSLKEWFRSTWTLQDDPCKTYYELIIVNPILLVPPTKAISVTITTFITEPLKHFGQGISEFLRALLKDLPVTLQIPVLITIVLAILVLMYGSVQAVFQYGITAPLRRRRRDPPPPELEQPQPRYQRIMDCDHLAEGDVPERAIRQRDDGGRLQRNQVRQRRPDRAREEPQVVETLVAAGSAYSEDEADGQREERPEAEQNLSADKDSEDEQETPEEEAGANASSVAANTSQAKNKPQQSNSAQPKAKPLKVNKNNSQKEPSKDKDNTTTPKPQPAGRRSSLNADRGVEVPAEDKSPLISPTHVETVGVPVQETDPA